MRKLLPLVLILLVATVAFAQNRSRIIGTVTTPDGAVIVDVKVTIESDALIARTLTTSTNDRGQFRFVLLPVGTYKVTFEKDNYKSIEQDGVVVNFDETVTLDKVMTPSEFEEVITITGEAPVVDKTSTTIGDKLDVEFIQNTPNNRNVWNLPNLSAGYTDDSGFGAVEDAGNAYNQDGVNVSDPSTGTVFSSVNIEAVEQVDINLFGSNAEYGAFTGASLNVVTKSGGNDYSGEANLYFQSAEWVSDNTTEYDSVTVPDATRIMNPAVALGGPVVKDKAWFFVNYNYSKSEVQHEIANDQSIIEELDPKRFFGKVTIRWDDRHITAGNFTYYDRYRTNRQYTWPVNDYSAQIPNSLWNQESESKTFRLQHSYVFSDDIILEARYAGFRGGFSLVPIGGNDNPLMFDLITNQHMPGSSANREDDLDRPRDNILLTANYFNDDWAGNHSFKFGFEFESSASYRKMWLDDLQLWQGDLTYLKYSLGVREASTRIRRFAGYAQDSWSLNDRLTINYGFRMDHTAWKSDTPELAPIGDATIHSFDDPAYRFGFAYDLFGDGKTIIRAFGGRYYEGVTSSNTETLAGDVPPQETYYGRAVFGPNAPEWTLWSVSGGEFEVDPEMENQFREGFTIGVEHELRPNMAVSAHYIWTKDKNVFGTIAPDAVWDTAQANLVTDNGSYTGVYYPNYNSGSLEVLTSIREGLTGVMQTPYRKFWGVVLGLNKRMSDNWSLKASYQFSRNEGTMSQLYSAIQGFASYSDPNFWINRDGRLLLERPHVFKVGGTYIAPFDIYVSPVVTYMSGWPYPILATVGTARNLYTKPVDGSDRFDSQFNIDLRLDKSFMVMDRYRLSLVFDVFNMLNDDAIDNYQSTNITSSSYLMPSSVVPARFYQVGVRVIF